LADKNGVFAQQRFKYNTDDYWLGHAFSLDNDNSERSKITNLIVAGRFLNINYLENPLVAYDSIGFYTDEKLLLTSVGINARNFVQERYLFNNGIIEDVPIGKTYSISTGYQRKNHKGQLYVGTRASFGNYYRWGFFSLNAEWGAFFKNSKTSQAAFTFQANYFTKLYEIGDWKIRQFLKQRVVLGSHRLASTGDQITLNGENGIPGFNNALYGTKKMVFSAQTQSYSPWNLWGFRLNPFFNYTIGVLGNDKKTNLKNQTYSSIGLGLIINNDYLVFSSFQLSFAYYPTTFGPDDKNLRTNAFETSDFGLLDFELNKPQTVNYK
jgi:hemolysin activation/secretion protein